MPYLKDIPNSAKDFGLCKILAVRQESIHLKHIFTEIFVRKSIDIESMLSNLEMTIFDYMEVMTEKFRRIYHLDREFECEFEELLKQGKSHNLFEVLNTYSGLNNQVVLDFDGVVTDYYFQKEFLPRLEQLGKVVICSANSNVKRDYFEKRNLSVESIFSCRGKFKKIHKLIELSKLHDNVFYIDNEVEYLEYAWIFGIKTYLYNPEKKNEAKIRYFTRKTA